MQDDRFLLGGGVDGQGLVEGARAFVVGIGRFDFALGARSDGFARPYDVGASAGRNNGQDREILVGIVDHGKGAGLLAGLGADLAKVVYSFVKLDGCCKRGSKQDCQKRFHNCKFTKKMITFVPVFANNGPNTH